jgi:hypothetical protein
MARRSWRRSATVATPRSSSPRPNVATSTGSRASAPGPTITSPSRSTPTSSRRASRPSSGAVAWRLRTARVPSRGRGSIRRWWSPRRRWREPPVHASAPSPRSTTATGRLTPGDSACWAPLPGVPVRCSRASSCSNR